MKKCKKRFIILYKQQRTSPVARHLLLCLSIFQFFNFSFFLVSCTESFGERCRREAREYTERQCPRLIDKYIVMDSMTYEDEPQGFTYHQTVQGELDNDSLLTPEALSTFQEELLARIRKDISLRRYKERGFTFTYRYTSASTGKLFTEVSFGPEEYR